MPQRPQTDIARGSVRTRRSSLFWEDMLSSFRKHKIRPSTERFMQGDCAKLNHHIWMRPRHICNPNESTRIDAGTIVRLRHLSLAGDWESPRWRIEVDRHGLKLSKYIHEDLLTNLSPLEQLAEAAE